MTVSKKELSESLSRIVQYGFDHTTEIYGDRVCNFCSEYQPFDGESHRENCAFAEARSLLKRIADEDLEVQTRQEENQ